jgi:hypothetical protein
MRRLTILFLALMIFGCGDSFKNEVEERSYLSALSNPTPTQWKRLKHLQWVAESKRRDEEEAINEQERQKRIKISEEESWAMWLRTEAMIAAKEDKRAVENCRRIRNDYPSSKAAAKALEALNVLPYFEP